MVRPERLRLSGGRSPDVDCVGVGRLVGKSFSGGQVQYALQWNGVRLISHWPDLSGATFAIGHELYFGWNILDEAIFGSE